MPDEEKKPGSTTGRNIEEIVIPESGVELTINIYLSDSGSGGPHGAPITGPGGPHGGPVIGSASPHGGDGNGSGDSGPTDGSGRPHGGDGEARKRIVINIYAK